MVTIYLPITMFTMQVIVVNIKKVNHEDKSCSPHIVFSSRDLRNLTEGGSHEVKVD